MVEASRFFRVTVEVSSLADTVRDVYPVTLVKSILAEPVKVGATVSVLEIDPAHVPEDTE